MIESLVAQNRRKALWRTVECSPNVHAYRREPLSWTTVTEVAPRSSPPIDWTEITLPQMLRATDTFGKDFQWFPHPSATETKARTLRGPPGQGVTHNEHPRALHERCAAGSGPGACERRVQCTFQNAILQ